MSHRPLAALLHPLTLLIVAGCNGATTSTPDASPALPPLLADPAVDTSCRPGPVAAGTTRAKPITCTEELLPGHLAAGRMGDLLLENARVRAVVRGRGAGFYMAGTSGGGLVDLAAVGGEDLVKEFLPLIGLASGRFDEIVITEAGDDGVAEITLRGRAELPSLIFAALGGVPPAVLIEHRYRLAADASELELTTTLHPVPDGDLGGLQLADALFLGGRARTFIPGTGFGDGGAQAGPFVAIRGTTSSYALVYPPSEAQAIQVSTLSGIRLAFGPSIDPTFTRTRSRWLVVGHGDVAEVAGRAWQLRGAALGTIVGVTAPDVDVAVLDPDGGLVSYAHADADGAFRAEVPPGDYRLRAEGPGRIAGDELAVTVTADAETQADVAARPAGALIVTVHDDGGAPLPARVQVEDASGKRIAWSGADGTARVPLPPGPYRVSVSRGMEYDAFVANPVDVLGDVATPLEATLARVVATDGWLAVDTHLHSEMSTDSIMPLDDRVRAIAAEGIELAIATDHDFITDYAPIVAELGLDAHVAVASGAEVSSLAWGHLNGWPLPLRPDAAAQGAIPWYGLAPGEVFALFRAADADAIVQVNHPRRSGSGLFGRIDLDPTTLTARRDPVDLGLPDGANLDDLSFDTVEVANGISEGSFEAVFADWLALVGAGHPATATGSSDSHGASAYVGEARTYVFVGAGADTPATVDLRAVNEAIRARHVVVAQGAFVTAGLVGVGGAVSLPGELVPLVGATEATLRIEVAAPPWLPLARIRILDAGVVVRVIDLDPAATAPVRYAGQITMPLGDADTFFIVAVDAAGAGDPVIGTPGPSFTNPLLVDHDGDGLFRP